jgi:hypothetical protein
VHKQFGKSNAIAILLAIENESGKPVGSCTTYAHWRDKEAAYVGTLGVSPEALGKKVGKRLLLESLKRASEKGYTRVDLNTWAGNMKAVPLYKKIGMMWNPEISGVHMEDYIPGILQHPLCLPFFEQLGDNGDWYNIHVRDPTQAPDDYEVDGLAVFPYEFKNDDDTLSVTVDRYGRGISTIERSIGNSRIKIRAKVNSHTVLCGISYTYTFEMENETSEDKKVSLYLEAFEGMVFDDKHTTSKTVAAGENYEWTVSFHLDSSAPLYRDNIKAPTILTKVEIDGQKSELVTGIKVQPAAEVKTRWGTARIAAGGKTTIPLTIVNNLSKKSKAHIKFDIQDSPIAVTSEDAVITLDAEGFGGTVLQVTSDRDLEEGAHDIWVSLEIETGKDKTVKTRKFRIPVYCLGEQGVVVGKDDRRRRLAIVSPIYDASISREGAVLRVNNHYNATDSGHQVRSTIGPPFGINPFRFADRDASVTKSANETVVSMKASHPDRPLDIEERTTFEHRSGIILHEVWVTNTNSRSETFQLRLNGRGGGISFSEGDMYVPLASGVLKEKLGNFYAQYPAIPSDPPIFSEGWIVLEQAGYVSGEMWNHSDVEEVRLGHGQISMISYPQLTLEPGETRRVSQLWLVYGAQSWEHVRRLWHSRVAGNYLDRIEYFKTQEPKRLVNLETDTIVVPYLKNVDSTIRLSKSTLVPLNGKVRVFAPEGWTASIDSTDIETQAKTEGSVATADIQLTHDCKFDLKLTHDTKLPDEFTIHRGQAEFASDWSLKKPIHLVQLGSSKGNVEVLEDVDQGLKVFLVNNGLIEFTVSPDYGGCLFSLKNSNGVEFLDNSFPTPAPKPGSFFDNYYGGVQPVVFDEELGEDIDKAKTNKEKMSAKPYEAKYWKGVEVSWVGKLQKLARGVNFKIRYLTTTRSPVIFIQWVITNKTSSPLKFWPTLIVDPNLSEQLAGGSYQTVWDDDAVELRKGMVPVAVTPTSNLVWIKPVENQKETSGFSFMMGGNQSRLLAANLGEVMLLGGVDGMTWLMPGEEKLITAALLVDPKSSDDVRDLQDALDKI